MNALRQYFENNQGRHIHKWDHYFDIYHSHFSRYRDREVVILEIGIAQGGSIRMWKDYFGEKAKIYAIDIDSRCKQFEEEGVEIFIGSQSNRAFLREVKARIPKVDILIDDGGHTMKQQVVTFEEMFEHVKDNGIYFCEDCHSSYWWEFGGGYKRRGTFMEYAKNWVDKVNAHHSRSPRLKVDSFTNTVRSVHFYDSIVVLEKARIAKPFDIKTGTVGFREHPEKLPLGKRLRIRTSYVIKRISALLKLPYRLD